MSYPTYAPQIIRDIYAEVERATNKFPTWPTDPIHAAEVVNEECGELNKAVLQQMYEPHKNKGGISDVRSEAIQTAAMAIRFLLSMDQYNWTQGLQHRQQPLD